MRFGLPAAQHVRGLPGLRVRDRCSCREYDSNTNTYGRANGDHPAVSSDHVLFRTAFHIQCRLCQYLCTLNRDEVVTSPAGGVCMASIGLSMIVKDEAHI